MANSHFTDSPLPLPPPSRSTPKKTQQKRNNFQKAENIVSLRQLLRSQVLPHFWITLFLHCNLTLAFSAVQNQCSKWKIIFDCRSFGYWPGANEDPRVEDSGHLGEPANRAVSSKQIPNWFTPMKSVARDSIVLFVTALFASSFTASQTNRLLNRAPTIGKAITFNGFVSRSMFV